MNRRWSNTHDIDYETLSLSHKNKLTERLKHEQQTDHCDILDPHKPEKGPGNTGETDDLTDDLTDLCVVQVGRGTCVSALWPRARRLSSCSPARRWLFTTCCCRPSSCGWSSSSAPSCSASTALSSCWDSSPCRPSPGDSVLRASDVSGSQYI